MKQSNRKHNHSLHLNSPDYSRPPLQIPLNRRAKIIEKLKVLYGETGAITNYPELERIMRVYYAHKTLEMIESDKLFDPRERFTQQDVILITYGDLIRKTGEPPLKTLIELSRKYLKSVFNTLHILPFFPYSTDRGFAVKNFEQVDPALGTWEDIHQLKSDFRLMFDGVFNHVSSQSRWFQEFLNQNPDYLNFFTVFSTDRKIREDYLKLLTRPRTSEPFTTFQSLYGPRMVWTTFSPDQIDLNYHNPRVLLKMIEILLFYVRNGADLIRLDAVTYLWDELGTTGVHLQQTHVIIQLFRTILDTVAPHVALVTETNVPHKENVSYFGDGENEAQMIYNFALPPLILNAFQTEDASTLTSWATGLERISDTATYFNFLDSHDGVGLMAVRNILSREEIDQMCLKALEHGGFISYKKEPDGTETPYEINITWYSALNREDAGEETALQVQRYLASRAIALVMMGVPGIYLHGLLGSRNDAEAVIEEGETRSINRKTLNQDELIRALLDPSTTTYQVTYRLARMIIQRTKHSAFHPRAAQRILNVSPKFFTVLRTAPDNRERILAVTNISDREQVFELDMEANRLGFGVARDLISRKVFRPEGNVLKLNVPPYGFYWLLLQS